MDIEETQEFTFKASYEQKRLWIVDQLRPGYHHYNIAKTLLFKGVLDQYCLQQALDYIVSRHEILRTCFTLEDQELIQVVAETASCVLDYDKVSVTAEELTKIRESFAHEGYSQPFDLSKLPLFRVRCLECTLDLGQAGSATETLVCITFHHIISDGVSAALFERELAIIYNCFLKGNQPDLGKPDLQYGDFSEWQWHHWQDKEYQSSLGYWQRQLADVEPLNLPTHSPRPRIASYQGRVHYFSVPAELSHELVEYSSQNRTSLFTLLIAMYQLLLQKYSGQDDICVGFPVAGRYTPETEDMVGCFVNTIALRTRVDGSLSFSQWISCVKDQVLDAQTHQDVPLEKIINAINPERDLSFSPLFQVMFSYQSNKNEMLCLGQLSGEVLPTPINTSKYDLTLSVESEGKLLSCAIEYSTELFTQDFIEQLAGDYERLLSELVTNPSRPIGSMGLGQPELDAAQSQSVSVPISIVTWFTAVATEFANRVALSCGDSALTYRELDQSSNRLAHFLLSELEQIATASDPQDDVAIIGISLPRTFELPLAILGVLKAGYAYVMLDPEYPEQRLAYYIKDSGLQLVLTLENKQQLFDRLGVRSLCIDSECQRIETSSCDLPGLSYSPTDLAYVIYTSGSTGNPKGVMVGHQQVTRLFSSTETLFRFSESDVWSLFHSTAFDFSVWEIWGAWFYGGRLVVVPHDISRSPHQFYQLLASEQITVLNQTPSAFSQLIKADAEAPLQLSLRYVVFGGEALDFNHLQQWYIRHNDQEPQLVNMYGITETTVHATFYLISALDVSRQRNGIIGTSLPDLRIYLLDKERNPVPRGVVGEMYVGGAGVALGYLNRPQLTAERFILNPFGEGRLYRSGDLAKYNEDGQLEYLGRSDQQVKVRGFRIELGEIEAALTSHPQLQAAVVLTHGEPGTTLQLVAYVVPQAEEPNIESLRAHLSRQMPDFMIPAAFVFMESLPLTHNGKINRKALPEPTGLRPALKADYQPPGNEKESKLCKIWADVLGLDKVGINDNFFALGGDSLRAVKVIDLVKQEGLALTLVDLFERQTVAGLAASNGEPSIQYFQFTHTEPFSQITAEDRSRIPDHVIDAYPLSKMQAAMFYHMALTPNANVYHCTGTSTIRLSQPFDRHAFLLAVQECVDQHDVLKTSFDLVNYSEPLQLVHSEATLPTLIEDLSHLTPSEQYQVIRELLEQEKKTPFDLTKPTLLRFFIHLADPFTFQFTMTECHPVFDGWSYHSLIVEVFNRYKAHRDNKQAIVIPQSGFQYCDFVALENKVLASDDQQKFWRDNLADCTILQLPRLQGETTALSPDIRLKRIVIVDEVYEGLRQVMRSAEVPMKSVMLAAHLKVMSLVSGEADLLTGIPTNGRPEESSGDRLFGLFLNILPFRFQLQDGDWITTIKAVFAAEKQLIPYRRYPFATIQQQHGNQPLIDEVLFNFLDFHIYNELDDSLGLEVLEPFEKSEVNEGTNFTLSVHFQHLTLTSNLKTNQIAIDIDYDINKISESQAESLKNYYQRVLTHMARAPGDQHQALPALDPTELSLISSLSEPQCVISSHQPLHSYFESLSASDPHGIVVCHGEKQVTRDALNRRANQLARYFIARGIQPGHRIALLLDKSVAFIECVLAAAKIGAVYLPLDTRESASRLQHILQAANPRLLVSNQWNLDNHRDALGAMTEPRNYAVVDDFDSELAAFAAGNITGFFERFSAKDGVTNVPLYIMFTSGSTGVPKGVEIGHHGVERLVRHSDYMEFEGATLIQLAPVNFDASTFEIWGALANQAKLVIYEEPVPTANSLKRVIADQSINSGFFTAALFNHLVDDDPLSLSAMDTLIVGGEALSVIHIQRFQSACPRVKLINGYGPTECTTFALTYTLPAPLPEAVRAIPIGKPIANTWVHILDSHHQPVPLGSPGELYLTGDGTALGYLDPAHDEGAFVSPEWAGGVRLYRTGDRVRLLPDGNVEYLGRLDSQVKIRGFRIEPGEIEAALLRHDGIEKAYVTVFENSGEKQLVAYWVAALEQTRESQIRDYLQAVLPKYMVPSYLIRLDEFPLRANGKLHLQALPAPDPDLRHTLLVAPGSDIERQILAIWQEVLAVNQISIHDNFFDLGGHSLLLNRVHNRLLALGFNVNLLDLLNFPSIATLSAHITGDSEMPAQLSDRAHQDTQARVLSGRERLAMLKRQRNVSDESFETN